MKDAPIEVQRVMILALHTGQRYSDLIHLRWSDFDGERLHLVQSKTSARVQVHCTAALLRMLTYTLDRLAVEAAELTLDRFDYDFAGALGLRMRELLFSDS